MSTSAGQNTLSLSGGGVASLHIPVVQRCNRRATDIFIFCQSFVSRLSVAHQDAHLRPPCRIPTGSLPDPYRIPTGCLADPCSQIKIRCTCGVPAVYLRVFLYRRRNKSLRPKKSRRPPLSTLPDVCGMPTGSLADAYASGNFSEVGISWHKSSQTDRPPSRSVVTAQKVVTAWKKSLRLEKVVTDLGGGATHRPD